ncbi:hypothetical protein FRB99_004734 [Tulasnella sp. 403]|nr:hypothetical protein FRB99_004734 [Tulasnella sp. 403]
MVHNGFATAQGKTASAVITAVKNIMRDHGVTKVACVGHSLGGAIAILGRYDINHLGGEDAVSLKQTLPSSTAITLVTYGQPRVGNQAFADWVDSHLPTATRITNKDDLVPIVPGRFLGFHHNSGEKHISPSGTWYACQGQDNEADPQCSTGEVANVFDGNTSDHSGPYDDGISMGC